MSSNDYSYDTTSDPTMGTAEYRDSYTSGGADTTQYPDKAADIPLRARGADNLQTGENVEQEDIAAVSSVDTGRVSKDKADSLAGMREKEMGTRGVKTDAFNQDTASDSMQFSERT